MIEAEATSELLLRGEPDMSLMLAISDKIKSKSFLAKDAAKSLKRRLNNKNPNAVLLSLDLTDVCVKNAGRLFLAEIASKEFMDALYQMVKSQVPVIYYLVILVWYKH
jgi:hepatocyte growth factor-regulated tyrosine kinase substrate